MFIAEGRTAGVFAALAIAAGPALVGSAPERADQDSLVPPTSVPGPALLRHSAGQPLKIVDGRTHDVCIYRDCPRGVAGPPRTPPVGHAVGSQCGNFRG